MSKSADGSDRVFQEPNRVIEECASCGRETPHEVSIEILEESTKPGGASYSREPYRVTVCDICETREELRMNDQ